MCGCLHRDGSGFDEWLIELLCREEHTPSGDKKKCSQKVIVDMYAHH